MEKDCGQFGFIRQDAKDGEEPQHIFVLPYSCTDSRLPPVGCRVEYSNVTDPKTGKTRAEDVIPEGTGDDRPSGWNPVPGEVYYGTICREKNVSASSDMMTHQRNFFFCHPTALVSTSSYPPWALE